MSQKFQAFLDKLKLVHKDAMARLSKADFKFKMDAEMLSFILINGFFLSILLFLQLFLYFIFNYSSDIGWFSFLAAVGVFRVFLRPTEDEKLSVQGFFSSFDGYQQFKPRHVHKPTSEKEISDIVRAANEKGSKVKVFGAGTTWNAIGVTQRELILLDRYNKVLDVNTDKKTVKVEAGIRLGELSAFLWESGLSIPNLGYFSMQTVGGAISTTTHASSTKNTSLGAQVVALDLVTANGEVQHITQDDKDLFGAARNGLGCLGVISTVTLQCVSAFHLEKTTQVVPIDQITSDINNRLSSNEYFSFWYIPHANQANLFIANKIDKKESSHVVSPVEKYKALAIKYGIAYAFSLVYRVIFTLTAVLEFLTPTFLNIFIATLKKSQTTERSYHALFENFAEIFPAWSEVEYFVPLENAGAVLKELQSAIKSGGWKVNFPTRVSFVKNDNVWLSEAFGRDSACFEIAMFKKQSQWKQFVKKIDTIMKKYEGRPHWGKYHQLTKQDLESLYPRWNDFQEVRKRLDPNGIFLNEYLSTFFA